MIKHMEPSTICSGSAIPLAQVVMEDGLFGKDDISKVDHLLGSHWGMRVFGKFRKVVDGIENGVNRLKYIEMHVVQVHLFAFDVLRCDVTIVGSNKM
jgi:hypothetical protein